MWNGIIIPQAFLRISIISSIFLLIGSVSTGCTVMIVAPEKVQGPPTVSAIEFAGLDSIDQVNGTFLRLNWTHVEGAEVYQIYEVSSGTPQLLTEVTPPTATFTLTDLDPAKNYKFRVRLKDSEGLPDDNTHDLSVTTATVTATFSGWKHVKALGPKVPALQAPDLDSEAASVTLEWDPVVLNTQDEIESYRIYRANSAGTETFSTPLATGIAPNALTYTDTTVVAGQTYYYNVMAILKGEVLATAAAADREIKVIVPQNNMVLLHPWVANREMCTLMNKAYDRANNYRCEFTGPGGNGTYYDQGDALFVDRFELGCNYSAAPGKCGSADGCIGILATPNGTVTGDGGDVYYSRQSAKCFINTAGSGLSGTTWTEASAANAAQLAVMGSSAPGLPPFVYINQEDAQQACAGLTVSGVAGTKRLLRRKESIAILAWSSALTDEEIEVIENGEKLDATGHCNSNSASATSDGNGRHPSLTFENIGYPGATNRDTLPACLNGDCQSAGTEIRSLRTGSRSTQNCVSRYGIQDGAGNVWEWTSDQVDCDGTQCEGKAVGANTIDASNDDFSSMVFDGLQGKSSTGKFVTQSVGVQFPIGVPIMDSNHADDGTVAMSAEQLHADALFINLTAESYGAAVGASYAFSFYAGRYALSLGSPTWYSYFDLGARCVIEAE